MSRAQTSDPPAQDHDGLEEARVGLVPDGDLVEGVDVALDRLQLAEVGGEDRVDQARDEGRRIEPPDELLVVDLRAELIDRPERPVVDGDDVIGAEDDVQFVAGGSGVIGFDGPEGHDDPVGQAQEARPAVHPAEAPETLAVEADCGPGPSELSGLTTVDVDPQQSILVDLDRVVSQVDFSILALRVVQDRADGQRTRARIPAVTTAISAIAHSTTRIE